MHRRVLHRMFVSLVGFLILRTSILDLPIPFRRNFKDINLRIYMRRPERDGLDSAINSIVE